MSKLKRARTERPAETTSAAAGSVAGVVIWLGGLAGIDVTPAAAGAIVVIVGWLAAWVTRRQLRRNA